MSTYLPLIEKNIVCKVFTQINPVYMYTIKYASILKWVGLGAFCVKFVCSFVCAWVLSIFLPTAQTDGSGRCF